MLSRKFKPRSRLALTLLCLLACTVQNFVAQSHVHASSLCGAAGITSQVCAADGDAPTLHARDDTGNHGKGGPAACPLCQVVLHGAIAPLTSSALSVSLAVQSSSRVAEQLESFSVAAISYHWQSRGPPRH